MSSIPLTEPAVREVGSPAFVADDFELFFEEALPGVYGYFLCRCGGQVPVAEDLTQETFTAAVGELKKGRRVDTVLPWLYGIARHKLLDHYRRQQRREQAISIDSEADVDFPIDTTSDEARERAVVALAAVPVVQREVLVLQYLDGFSVPEIASAIGKSVAAVESLLARGRVSFKRAYLEVST
jgi:RNA polymerase sigma-70 factor (ECF subfamily)